MSKTAFGSDGLDGCRYDEAANEITRLRCELENADMAGYKRGFNDARDLARAGDYDVVPELSPLRASLAEAESDRECLKDGNRRLREEFDSTLVRLAEAERERDDKSRQIAELQEQLHHLYAVEQRAERGEAALAAALKISNK